MKQTTNQPTRAILRLVLYPGEVYRLPQTSQGLRIREGQAWLSHAGEDILLCAGQEAAIGPGKDYRLVSAVGKSPLILEILGNDRPSFSVILRPVLSPTVKRKALT